MNPLYRINIKALQQNNNCFIAENSLDTNYKIEIIPSKDGNYSLFFNNDNQKLFLHSKYAPVKQSVSLLKDIDFNNIKIIFIFGFGLGYHIQQVIKRMHKDTKVIIVEPSKLVFDEAIKKFDYTDVFCSKNVYVCIQEYESYREVLLNIINYEDINSMHILTLSNYDKAFNNEYKIFLQEIDKVILQHKLSANTLAHFSSIWERNIIENIPALLKSQDVECIENIYKNIPIIVVSAGPSLNKNVQLLKSIKDKVIIVSVGTAIKSLYAIGIQPDFIISIDGGEINFQHFKDINYDKATLVFSPKVFSQITKHHKGQKIRFCVDDFMLEEILDSLGIKTDILSGEASVSTYAINLAVKMGGNPVVLLGQDLAYTNNKTHASKTIYENDRVKDKCNVSTFDIYGNQVFTTHKLLDAKRCLEELIQSFNEDIICIDATEGGLWIKGTKPMSLHQTIDTHLLSGELDEIKSYIFPKQLSIVDKDKVDILIGELLNHKRIMNNIENYLIKGILFTEDIIKNDLHLKKSSDEKLILLQEINNQIQSEIDKLAIIKYTLKAMYYKNLNNDYSHIEKMKSMYMCLLKCFSDIYPVIDNTIGELKGLIN